MKWCFAVLRPSTHTSGKQVIQERTPLASSAPAL
jgi:hypothetical protein